MQAIGDTAALIDAYLRERAGYARRGLPAKVAEVDEQLARLGHRADPVPVEAPPQQPTEPPRKRSTRRPTEGA